MPSSRFLIASNTLTGTATSVTFSSIPATYEDLALIISVRDTSTSVIIGAGRVKFNSSTGTIYSVTRLIGDGSAASSTRGTSNDAVRYDCAGSNASMTSNTFTSFELYIPSYRASQNKPISQSNVTENNSTTAGYATINGWAHLYQDTAAITSITITPPDTFASGSSFWLYGLKSS